MIPRMKRMKSPINDRRIRPAPLETGQCRRNLVFGKASSRIRSGGAIAASAMEASRRIRNPGRSGIPAARDMLQEGGAIVSPPGLSVLLAGDGRPRPRGPETDRKHRRKPLKRCDNKDISSFLAVPPFGWYITAR